MKSLKSLVLAASATWVLMLVCGAGPASATVLCKTTTTPCGAANHYSEKTELEMKLEANTKSVIASTDSKTEDECSEAALIATTSNTGGATATIEAPFLGINFTFGNCSHTTSVLKGGKLEIHNITGSDNGTITATEFQITINTAGVSCTYGPAAGGTAIGTLVGPTNTVNVNTVLALAGGGFLCPSTVKWTATYKLARPATAVYVEPS